MQAYFRQAGAPYLPHFRTVNTRNIRAVFHRYNVKYNKGCYPGEDCRQADKGADEAIGLDANRDEDPSPNGPEESMRVRFLEDAAAEGGDCNACSAEDSGEECSREGLESDRGERNSMRSNRGRDVEDISEEHRHSCLGPDIWDDQYRNSMCCCQVRSMSTMEL